MQLRPVGVSDLDWLTTHWNRPEVFQFLFDGAGPSRTDVERTIRNSMTGWDDSGERLWIVQAGHPIGVVGLRPLDDLGPELYYSLDPEERGRGHATAAARAALVRARDELDVPVVFAEVDEANTKSRSVLDRLGMAEFDRVPGVLGTLIRYRRTLPRTT